MLCTLDIGCRTGLGEDTNDPEVTMSNALANTNLIAHEKALAAAGDAIALVLRVPAPLKSIADQVIRSASSVPANLAEGHGWSWRDRVHFWRIAYAYRPKRSTATCGFWNELESSIAGNAGGCLDV